MNDIVIYGSGDFAEVAYYYLSNDSEYNVVAFCVDDASSQSNTLFNLPIISFNDLLVKYPPNTFGVFIAIAYSKINSIREEIYNKVKESGYELISYVNSKSIIWDKSQIGDNCFILENNVIQPFVIIGNNVILWSGNHIGHHSKISDHCFISSHVVISGNVNIGENSFLGVNSTIRDGLIIGKKTIIGAGSLIMESTKENSVYISEKTKPSKIQSNELKHL
jgi:sugar O-acyltransferase (sialic acid O-acetyltransferase NeuD family)